MKLAKAKTMYNIRLTNEKIKQIRDKSDEMHVYQEDIINDATNLYFEVYERYIDECPSNVCFGDFISDICG